MMKVHTAWHLLALFTFRCNGLFSVAPEDVNTPNSLASTSSQVPLSNVTYDNDTRYPADQKKDENQNATVQWNNSSANHDNSHAVPIFPGNERDDVIDDDDQSYRPGEIEVLGRTALLCNGSTCPDPSFADIWVNCYCDHHCILFGDCCVDYFQKLLQTIPNDTHTFMSDPVGFYRTYLPSPSSVDDNINLLFEGECHMLYRSRVSPILLIKKCPNIVSIEILDWVHVFGCEEPYADFPVTSKLSSDIQIVYKNKHCAFCNGLSEDDVLPWSVQAGCPDSIVFGNGDVQSTLRDKCTLLYKPPNMSAQPRNCLWHNMFTTPLITPDIASSNLCRRYIAPFQVQHEAFQNPHCRQSSGQITNQTRCITSLPDNLFVLVIFNPVELIFNFDINNGIWQLYQPKHNRCQSGMKIQGVCHIPSNILFTTNATLPMKLNESNSNSVLLYFRLENIYINNITNEVQNAEIKWKNMLSMWDAELVSFTNNAGMTVGRPHFILRVQSDSSQFVSSVIKILQHECESGMTIQTKNYQVGESFRCEEDSKLVKSTQAVFDTHAYLVIHIIDTFMSIFVEHSRFTINIDNSGTPVIREILVCKEVPINLTCAYIMFDNQNYYVENETIYLITDQDKRAVAADNTIRNGILYVCIDTDSNTYSIFDILNTLAVCISIVSLLVLLVLNCIYPSLLNLPGKIIFSLALTLLLSLILLATMNISNKADVACKVVAILSHYLWLCVFHWTAIMAYEFARMFGSNMLQHSQEVYAHRFYVYVAIAYGFPLLIVTVSIILDQTNTILSIGYGAKGTCWINEPLARMIFVVGPIGVLLMVALISLVIVMHGIQSNGGSIARAHVSITRRDSRKCLIYSKLFFLLGLTWVLAFITPLTNSRELIYISMFLNSMQGFFLFIIFAMNSRFITLIKKTFHNQTTSTKTSSNNTHRFNQI